MTEIKTEAARVIDRLGSSDPEFNDCADAVAVILRLLEDRKGPDDYETWRDAAVAEKVKRVRLEQAIADRDPWVPYLSDRADGVKGRFAIARMNPAGYREVWNLRRHCWSAFSDDVLTFDQAGALLKEIVIPTASPSPV